MTAEGHGRAGDRSADVALAARRASPRSRALALRALALRARAGAGTLSLPTTGDSMLPALEPDGRVVVEGQGPGRFGDVVVFVDAEGDIIVHRLVARFRGRLLCLGDNALAFDRLVPASQFVGRALVPRSVVGHAGHTVHVGARHAVRLVRRAVRAVGLPRSR